MLKKMYQERKLMGIWDDELTAWKERREKILQLLCSEEYGSMPKKHDGLTWEVQQTEADLL